jgi:ABC-2 type transport system ATP-binding protein
MASANPAIQVQGLVKQFGALTAVDDVSFEVQPGEVFGILGPNGAGKTTTLECIEGLVDSTAGRTLVLGMETHRETDLVKQRIGVQLQASAYFDYLTLREILRLFGRFYDRRIPPDDLLAQVGLMEKADSTVAKLSGGQKQRFTIAATLVNDPEVVFLDEPTMGLDPQARHNLWEFIRSIHHEGRTVVLTTHYMEEAEALCQRVAIMDRGKIVALDTPANLVRGLPVPYKVKVVLDGDGPVPAFQDLDAVVGVDDEGGGAFTMRSSDAGRTVPDLLALAGRTGLGLSHLEVLSANLEDVFLTLTGRMLRE